MHIGIWFRLSRRCLLPTVVSFFLVSSAAAFAPMPLKKLFEESIEVEVVLVPPSLLFRAALDEAAMWQQGCHYKTTASDDIAQVLTLVRNSIVAEPTGTIHDIRNGVIFTLRDGTKVRLLLEEPVGNNSINAVLNGTPLRMRGTLTAQLRDWSRKARAAAQSGINCR